MCGATGDQKTIQQEQIDQYQQMIDLTKQQYANQQGIFKPMLDKLQPIFAAGPEQQGFAGPELDTLRAQSTEGTAENYSQAAKAVGEEIGASGGDIAEPSGAADTLRAEIASSAAGEESKEQTQITEANYATGRENWQTAGEELMSIAAGENPLGYAGATTGSGEAASKTASDIAQEENSWVNAAIGAAGEFAGAYTGAKVGA